MTLPKAKIYDAERNRVNAARAVGAQEPGRFRRSL